MDFATLYTINRVLAAEDDKLNHASESARRQLRQNQDLYEEVAACQDCTEEYIQEKKEDCEFAEKIYKDAYEAYNRVHNALISFRAHDWR